MITLFVVASAATVRCVHDNFSDVYMFMKCIVVVAACDSTILPIRAFIAILLRKCVCNTYWADRYKQSTLSSAMPLRRSRRCCGCWQWQNTTNREPYAWFLVNCTWNMLTLTTYFLGLFLLFLNKRYHSWFPYRVCHRTCYYGYRSQMWKPVNDMRFYCWFWTWPFM